MQGYVSAAAQAATVLRHVFGMLQGWGNWFNTMVLVVLLAAFGENAAPYNTKQLGDVWRISYGIGLIPIITMLVWRVFFLRVSHYLHMVAENHLLFCSRH